MTQELGIIKTLWPIGLAFAALIVWGIRQEQAIRQDRAARIAADARIEEKVNAYNDHHKERAEVLTRSVDDIKQTQNKMVETLHNVEIGITALREYRNGQDDARKGRMRK